MKLSVQQIRSRIEKWCELLTDENNLYFKELAEYIRLSNLDQRKTETLLSVLLEHLLEAQRAGKTAQDIFGDSPIKYGEEIIKSMPQQGWRSLLDNLIHISIMFWAGIFMIYGIRGAIASLLPTSLESDYFELIFSKNILSFVQDIIFLWFLQYNHYWLLKVTHFQQTNRKKQARLLLKIIVCVIGYAAVSFILKQNKWFGFPTFEFNYVTCFIIGGIAGFYSWFWLKKQTNRLG